MASVRRSLLTTFAGTNGQTLVALVASVILARLLTPAEIGLFSVGAALVAMFQSLRDFGIGGYIIQEKDLTEVRMRTALGLALTVSWSMGAGVLWASEYIGGLYDDPTVATTIGILAVSFFLLPFGSTTRALLIREMRFPRVYLAEILGACANALVSITLALNGFGALSLAWGALAASTVTVGVLIGAARDSWRSLVPSLREVGRVFSVGSRSSLGSVLGAFGQKLPELVTGKLLGFHETGILSKAMGAVQVFFSVIVQAVGAVATPDFAKSYREGRNVAVAYELAMSYLHGIAVPFFAVLGLCSSEVILVLFGDQWGAAAPLVTILCFAAVPWLQTRLDGWLLTATGHMQQFLNARIAWLGFTAVLVLAAGAVGLEALAAATGVAHLLSLWWYRKGMRAFMQVSRRAEIRILLVSAGLALATAGPVLVVRRLLVDAGFPAFGILVLAGVTAAVSWLLALMILRHPLWFEVVRGLSLVWRGVRLRRQQ